MFRQTSENVQALKRQINGLMNKLSDQSKDTIIRSIKALFDKNSVTVASLVLKDAILAACAHPTQVMGSLIPIYAAIVAALHCSISIDVGAFMVENLTAVLVKSLAEATAVAAGVKDKAADGHSYISTKLPANALLLLVYLYNLRVLHHTLIVDIMNCLADVTAIDNTTGKAVASGDLGDFVELKVELLEHLINHCGVSVRGDDPVSLRTVVTSLSKRLSNMPAALEGDSAEDTIGNSRLRFMFEALTDLKNNKSRRIQTTNAEAVKKLRKWLGSMKAVLGQKQAGTSDTCLRVSLQDLLNAETKGRWWRTGASWVGKQQADDEKARAESEAAAQDLHASKKPKSAQAKSEEEKLLELAKKMGMNTATRRNIFVVMMSSRDVTDAFERLSRLELKGKEDREVARVLAQCCAQERSYNAFYAELAKLLCSQHRQYKITFQFVFWDTFKVMEDEGDEEGEAAILRERKAVNLARLLASLVCAFQLPLTVIKPIEIASMSPSTILFLSTLLLAIFKEKVHQRSVPYFLAAQSQFLSVVTIPVYCTCLDIGGGLPERAGSSGDQQGLRRGARQHSLLPTGTAALLCRLPSTAGTMCLPFAVVYCVLLMVRSGSKLQRYMPSIPKGLDPADGKKMQQRRKTAIRTFEAMSVLDISKGMMKDDEEM